MLLATFLGVHSNSKEVSYLSWQNMYPNLKTTRHIKLKFFLWTKLLHNLLLANYLMSTISSLKNLVCLDSLIIILLMCTLVKPPMENLFFTKLSTSFFPKLTINFFTKFNTSLFTAFIFSHPHVLIFICQNVFLSVRIFFICDYLWLSFFCISIQEVIFIRFFTMIFTVVSSIHIFLLICTHSYLHLRILINTHLFSSVCLYFYLYSLILLSIHLFLLVLTSKNFTIKQLETT